MNIKYIGRRPSYHDGLYGTGQWNHETVKDVPGDVAAKMLRHPDQYAAAESDSPVEPLPVVPPPHGDDDKDQDTLDLVATMDRDQLATFAMTNFSVKITHNMLLENARNKVAGLIKQYGMA